MDLRHQRGALAFQALDEVQLPKRLAAVELSADEPSRELPQLLIGTGRRQGDPDDVAPDIELGIELPRGAPDVERRLHHSLAVARDQVHPRLDALEEAPVRYLPFKDSHGADTHRRFRSLQVIESGILRAQAAA